MSSNKHGLKCVIPEGVRNINDGLFDGVTDITGIQLPSTLKRIGQEAFSFTSIQSVTTPEGVTSIEWCCFRGCVSLTSVTLPPTLKLINEKAFYRTSIREVIVMGGIKKYWCKVPLFIKNILNKKGIECPNCYLDQEDIKRKEVTIENGHCVVPEGVISIGNSCFKGCSSLTSIQLLSTLMSIGDCAIVYNPTSFESHLRGTQRKIPLKQVEVPKNCKIGLNAFEDDCKVIFK